MIVLFHVICSIFSELSTPAWQNEVRQITLQCVEAMEEAKKIKYGLRMTPCSLAHDRSIAENKSCCFSHFILHITSGFFVVAKSPAASSSRVFVW